MTKEQFLARCSNAYDSGLITEERMHLMERWLDVVMREGHSRVCDYMRENRGQFNQDQWKYVTQFWDGYGESHHGGEVGRLLRGTEETFGQASEPSVRRCIMTLANDADGMALVRFGRILSLSCQQCATDSRASWGGAYCPHFSNTPAAPMVPQPTEPKTLPSQIEETEQR